MSSMEQVRSIVNTYGVETIIRRIVGDTYKPFNFDLVQSELDFRLVGEENPKFVQPVLSEVDDYSMSSLEKARFILIEAVGASGKTELTKYMSAKLCCPIIDLGKTRVVAGNSLTGLLFKRMQRKDANDYMDDISEGRSTIIIDALDEGYMKTNAQGYHDFIDDLIDLNPQTSCPIIMLGRYNAVELAALYLLDKDVSFITLQIEPFTLQQATAFIDKSVNTSSAIKYEQIYKQTRDYILQTIGGFFKNQASIRTMAAERFIGYAPVLQSIAAFFDSNTNFQVVLDDLKAQNTKSVSLIVDIIKRILKRDRDEKAFPNFINDLIKDRDETLKKIVLEKAYTDVEQCARILYCVMNIPFPGIDIQDPAFVTEYNEHISAWIMEHPFMGKRKISNIVFESYILAVLLNDDRYKEAAYRYMRSNSVSYMFAYIYKELYGFEQVDKRVLPYIYTSLRELNSKTSSYSFSLSYIKKISDQEILCEFAFDGSNSHMENYNGKVIYLVDDVIDLGSTLEHLNINVPLSVVFSAPKIDIWAPTYICCSRIEVNSEEIILYKGTPNTNVMLECEEFAVNQLYSQYVQISGPGKDKDSFVIVAPNKLDYPFYDYCSTESERMDKLTDENYEKYKKLRAIILEFRSHSKNELAKHYEKIDFILGNTPVAKKVIDTLVQSGIMYREGHLYKINSDIMDRELGLSYDGIRNFGITKEIIDFLSRVK